MEYLYLLKVVNGDTSILQHLSLINKLFTNDKHTLILLKSEVFRHVPVMQIRPDSWISEEPTFVQACPRVEEM